jgi:bacteriocin biosynthesis cyclodehydratase domain-containing protein
VGIAAPAILEGLSSQQAAYVASLEGAPRTPGGTTTSADLSQRLADLGLLAPPDPELTPAVICVMGADDLGASIGRCVAQAGMGTVIFDDPTPGTTAAAARGAGTTRAQAAARDINAVAPRTARAADLVGSYGGADITVAVAHGALSTTAVHDLMVTDQPHLPVVSDEAGITVGPLVTPGTGPCLICLGIRRAESDPTWPLVAIQCNGARTSYAPAPVRSIAAGVAAAAVSRYLADGRADARQWRIENGPSGPSLTTTIVAPHPACGCGDSLVLGDNLEYLKSILL